MTDLNKSHFIDLELLNYYDSLVADSEKELHKKIDDRLIALKSYAIGSDNGIVQTKSNDTLETNNEAGIGAIALGDYTYASRKNSVSIGEYGIKNNDALFIVAGGTAMKSKNLFEIQNDKTTIFGATISNNNDVDEWILDGGTSTTNI